MKELTEDQFYLAAPLLTEDGSIEVRAVLDGINKGRVFVDQVTEPASAVVWLGNMDGIFILGEERNPLFTTKLRECIDLVIGPASIASGVHEAEVLSYHPNWDLVLDDVFGDRPNEKWEQFIYRYPSKESKNPDCPEGYRVVPIEKALVQASSFSRSLIHEKIQTFWSSPEDFYENGIGLCVMKDHEVATICMTGFRAGNVHAIDIETYKAFKKRGLGTTAAKAFVKECIAEGGVPYWDCAADNVAAVRTAEKSGFLLQGIYRGIAFEFDTKRVFQVNTRQQ
ncbi:GNAT family N-acetyltransferase [Jeotgalibacillus terrae]|uniref:GNAT family N-acetyltransferase n=1 Tax=Jeotgalibacillus terrae TaxID=587735 RepID=A0ABW5ZHA6_9BACL|nr:GNAT family N-acetyltransferase [Jeotgalibacillus terrae]MBM7579346.1 RimJ/RimL family protein N-acetyltransferase [Jeotgalibacillus terrae]